VVVLRALHSQQHQFAVIGIKEVVFILVPVFYLNVAIETVFVVLSITGDDVVLVSRFARASIFSA
jgi:hypothetical protein